MYEPFNDEKRALFSDMESYALITELWCVFSEYLLAINKRYDNYERIHLEKGFSIRRRTWYRSAYLRRYIQRSGMTLTKRKHRFSRNKKILTIDHLGHQGYTNEIQRNPATNWSDDLGIFGIDLDGLNSLQSVIDMVRKETHNAIQAEEARVTRLKEHLNRRS